MGEISPYEDDKKKEFFEELEKQRPDLMNPEAFTDKQRNAIANEFRETRVKTGMLSSIPMRCEGPECHPSGTPVLTSRGYKPIEKLDPDNDLLISWDRNNQAIRGGHTNGNIQGYEFSLHERHYHGNMIKIWTDDGDGYECTHDHLVPVRWTDDRQGFAVYIMRKGPIWRVGKSKIFLGSDHSGGFGPVSRAKQEGAESLWVLSVHDTNTEAMLEEEYISVEYGISRSCFTTSKHRDKSKDNGLYRWVTQSQLDEHHKRIAKPEDFYRQILYDFGLCINCPIWNAYDLSNSVSSGNQISVIKACNVLSKYMECPTNDTVYRHKKHESIWKPVFIETYETIYKTVYSLEVDKHETYVANGLVTHNCPYAQSCPLQQDGIAPIGSKCPIEQSIVNQFFHDYVEELDVDVSRMVEVSLVRDLVDQEVQHMRKTWLLSQEHFIQEAVVGIDADGRVVTAKELHKAVEYEDKILRRKEKLRNALLATRESKAKSGQANVDSAQVMANLLQEVRQVELERERALKKKLGLEIHDEYIDAQVVEDDEEE